MPYWIKCPFGKILLLKKLGMNMAKLGFVVFLICFITLEVGLRLKSRDSFFFKVLQEDIVFYEPFIINEHNIFCHQPSISDSLDALRNSSTKSLYRLFSNIQKANIDITEKYLCMNYLAQMDSIIPDEGWMEETSYQFLYEGVKQDLLDEGFKKYKTKLAAEFNLPEESDLNEAVQRFTEAPINSEGLRSIDMKPYTTKRKKILLNGDSTMA